MAGVLVPMIRTFHAGEFQAADLVGEKRGQRISVCLPARDEQDTVGAIVSAIRSRLMDDVALVDELVVVDDHSSDRTAALAAEAGARVVDAATVLAHHGPGHGKGEAMWKSLHVTTGDIVIWCDADIRQFDTAFVVGLVGPLLRRPELAFVKGFYERPIDGRPDGGGRVTELMARPVLSLLFPQLSPIVQPLAGEYGGRREVLEQLPFVQGYGVDIGLLIDVAERCGIESIAQVDLGVRVHRNRSLDELSPQATAVLQAALRRADRSLVGPEAVLVRPSREPVVLAGDERPPLVTLPEHQAARSTELRA